MEDILDRSGVPGTIEALLPVGVRSRQLSVRTLLLGILLTQADDRPCHLTRVHEGLCRLSEAARWRLGVSATWRTGPHLLTYRQCERTFSLVVAALAKDTPDGEPSDPLREVMDALMEATIPVELALAPADLAVDWSDLEAFSLPPHHEGGSAADPEASWGRRKCDAPGRRDELFFGYELQAATMVAPEAQGSPPVPELARRITVTTCSVDPPGAFVPVLARLVAEGVVLGDVLADSGYSYREATHWALPLRALGAAIVTDLHPNDRGTKGTHQGAIIWNGNLYCPRTPVALLELGPLSRQATHHEITEHDTRSAELAHYKLGRISADDHDGYHRVTCPAIAGKVRCPLRDASMALPHTRPEVLDPPDHRPRCCEQQTLTVPVEIAAKTRQKHDYPSKAHRASYARRTAVERTFSTTKDRASIDMTRGWCRVMGLTAISLMATMAFVARNERVLDAFAARQAEDARRRARGLPPRTRKRRRKGLNDLVNAPIANPPPS
jgi:hypothetical protein